MTITIAPFTVDLNYERKAPPFGGREEQNADDKQLPITYWGIYLDDKYISQTSTKELAEKTKLWIEKWLKDRI